MDIERWGEAGVGGGEVERSEREYILLWGRLGVWGEMNGRVSRRYIRMKPRIREMPIQAWGVRSEWGSSDVGLSLNLLLSFSPDLSLSLES